MFNIKREGGRGEQLRILGDPQSRSLRNSVERGQLKFGGAALCHVCFFGKRVYVPRSALPLLSGI